MIYANYGRRIAESTWLSGCCGAGWVKNPTEKTSLRRTHKGIRLIVGKHEEPYSGPKQHVDIVETKNGTITVGIRHAW